jgi:hypothetical protein
VDIAVGNYACSRSSCIRLCETMCLSGPMLRLLCCLNCVVRLIIDCNCLSYCVSLCCPRATFEYLMDLFLTGCLYLCKYLSLPNRCRTSLKVADIDHFPTLGPPLLSASTECGCLSYLLIFNGSLSNRLPVSLQVSVPSKSLPFNTIQFISFNMDLLICPFI